MGGTGLTGAIPPEPTTARGLLPRNRHSTSGGKTVAMTTGAARLLIVVIAHCVTQSGAPHLAP
jgi:hypothetical protein